MTIFQALFLGLVQGLTEFLPVSSSGHLVLSEYFFGIGELSLTYTVFLHFCTLLAVVLFFRKRILSLTLKEWWYVGIASIPAVVVGLFLEEKLTAYFSSLYLVLGTLFVTGVVNITVASLLKKRDKDSVEEMNASKAVTVGIFQAFALLPGISRSGSTVFGGVLSKLPRREAFEFSFIMSVPIIFGGSLYQLYSVQQSAGIESINWGLFLAGGLAAFTSGVVSLKVFRYVIEKARLEWFGWYCITLVVFVALFDIVPRL